GIARGKVRSRTTEVTRRAKTTVNATVPTATSSSRWVSVHHVDASRHGRSRSLITGPTLSAGPAHGHEGNGRPPGGDNPTSAPGGQPSDERPSVAHQLAVSRTSSRRGSISS